MSLPMLVRRLLFIRDIIPCILHFICQKSNIFYLFLKFLKPHNSGKCCSHKCATTYAVLLAYILLNKLRRLALNFLLSLTSTDYILSIVYLNTLGETTSNTNRLYCTPLTRDSRWTFLFRLSCWLSIIIMFRI